MVQISRNVCHLQLEHGTETFKYTSGHKKIYKFVQSQLRSDQYRVYGAFLRFENQIKFTLIGTKEGLLRSLPQ